MSSRTVDKSALVELDQLISKELKAIENEALDLYSAITGRPHSIQSFHATIGSKNNTYVDSVRTQFADFEDFKGQWLLGLRTDVQHHKNYPESSACRIARLLQNPLIQRYTFLFLERNFYRNYVERTRAKPDMSLWRMWFGDNHLLWGLIIAPVFKQDLWTNDKSEMRRADYTYWTVGHVMAEGLVDPHSKTPYHFAKLSNLLDFYRSVLKRVSNSMYEQDIADRYISYLENSEDPMAEPFLIPELRYAGLEAKHRYRLDFTVLNAHTMSFVGFELSPHSTHYFMQGITKKTQKEMNLELAAKWEEEMAKRNAYFATYGVSTLTFTDAQLVEMDKCFNVIAEHLSARPPVSIQAEEELRLIAEVIG